jgi:hypothetical protein
MMISIDVSMSYQIVLAVGISSHLQKRRIYQVTVHPLGPISLSHLGM